MSDTTEEFHFKTTRGPRLGIERRFLSERKTWSRLEPLARNAAETESIRATIRDPAWMLARQWQVGEFHLEDAGSPVRAWLKMHQERVTRVRLRGNPEGETFDYDPGLDGPLEAVVERESLGSGPADARPTPPLRLRAEAGLYFLRLLRAHGVTRDGAPFTAADFPPDGRDPPLHLSWPEGNHPATDQRYATVMTGRAGPRNTEEESTETASGANRALDGHAVYRRIAADDPPVPADAPSGGAYNDVLDDYRNWYESLYDEPAAASGSAWDPERLEYRFDVDTGTADDETRLQAREYPGGRLDWYAFAPADESLGSGASIDAEGDDGPIPLERTVEVQRLPTQVDFPGMPAPRWWEMEDAAVNLEKISAMPEGISRLLLLEFAVIYGNDWFTLPVETPVGTLSRAAGLNVTDTFGVTSTAEVADGDWKMFMMDVPDHPTAGGSGKGLFLPPVLADLAESEPVERVLFTRDEMANLGFAVEERVEGPVGTPIDRDDHVPPTLAVQSMRPADEAADEFLVLHNTGSTELRTSGWRLEVIGTDETVLGDPIVLGERTLAPGAHITVATGHPPDAAADDGESGVDADIYLGRDASLLRVAGAVHVAVRAPTPPDESRGRIVERVRIPPRDGALLPAYRLATSVPDHWYPLKPTTDPDDPATSRFDHADPWRFRLALLLDVDALGADVAAIPRPMGRILADLLGHDIHEEEVTRAGVEVTRSYQLARWLSGTTHLWSGRRAGTGRGEGSSGLRFDLLDE